MKTIVFDIETGPLPESELVALVPPFDPAEVKTGNIKDPEKIAAKIAEAEANHRCDFFDKAALDPLTRPHRGHRSDDVCSVMRTPVDLTSSATMMRRKCCASFGN